MLFCELWLHDPVCYLRTGVQNLGHPWNFNYWPPLYIEIQLYPLTSGIVSFVSLSSLISMSYIVKVTAVSSQFLGTRPCRVSVELQYSDTPPIPIITCCNVLAPAPDPPGAAGAGDQLHPGRRHNGAAGGAQPGHRHHARLGHGAPGRGPVRGGARGHGDRWART